MTVTTTSPRKCQPFSGLWKLEQGQVANEKMGLTCATAG